MARNQLNVLFVDSEQEFVQVRDLFRGIKSWQFNLESVSSYDAAWEKIKTNQFDLCLFSYHLNRQDGLKFLQRVANCRITTSLVLLVEPVDHDLAAEFLDVGAVDYLVKGQVDIPLLKRVVRYAIRYRQLAEKAKTQTGQVASLSEVESNEDVGIDDQTDAVMPGLVQQDRMFFQLDVYGIEILDTNGRIVDCNETYQQLLGYSRKEIIGQHTTTFASESSKKIFHRKLTTLRRQGYAEGETELIRKDGSKVIVWRRYRAIHDEDGNFIRIVSFNRNITERLKAVRQISLLARALEQSPVAVMITDRDGVINYVNFKFSELTEYAYEEVIGKNIRSLETEWQSPEDLKTMWNTIAAGEEWRGEWYNLTKSGEVYWESTTAVPVFNAKGQLTHYVFAKENITARKELESDSMQTQRRMGALMTEQITDLTSANEALRFEIIERKRAEQELRQSQARLRAQYKGIPVPTYSWERQNGDFVLVDYNDAADIDSQDTIAKLLGKTAREVFKDRPEVLEDLNRCAAEKTIVRREGPYQLVATGENKYFITTYNFVPPNLIIVHIEDITKYRQMEADLAYYRESLDTAGEGKPSDELEYVKEALYYEITKREETERQARENEERLKLIASNIDERLREQYRTIPIPTYSWQMIGGEFVLIDFNDAAAESMGRIVDFFGKTAQEIFADRPQVLADFRRCYDERTKVVREAPYQLVTSGETRFFVTTYNYLPPNLIIVHIQDITDQKELENQLVETREAVWQERGKRQQLEQLVAILRVELNQLRQDFELRHRIEESLRESRNRLRMQYKGIPVPTYSWQRAGDDFVLVDYNDAAEKANHGQMTDLMGKPASEIFKDRLQVLADFQRCYAEQKTIQREAAYRLISREETRYFITTYNFVPPNLILVYIQDITEYKQTGNGAEGD